MIHTLPSPMIQAPKPTIHIWYTPNLVPYEVYSMKRYEYNATEIVALDLDLLSPKLRRMILS